MTQDYYQVLGIPRDASATDIRAAYARLAKRHHPDSAGVDDLLTRRFRDIQQAYRCLSDASRRADHDRRIAETERRHLARQRALLHRLHRYDRRHPHGPPRATFRRRWRPMLVMVIGAAVIARLSLSLIG